MGNVVGRPDRRQPLPRQAAPTSAAVAHMMAVGRVAEDGEPDVGEFLRNPLFA